MNYNQLISEFVKKLNEADLIIVGAASGMSAASGYRHYYERDEEFVEWCGDFEKKYGFHSTFEGFYYRYKSEEERIAFMCRVATCILSEELGITYKQLDKLLQGKNFHILTTNQDAQFNKLYPEEKISAIQGDWRLLQCSRRCHDGLYDMNLLTKLNPLIDKRKLTLDYGLLPKCPKCGRILEVWVT